MQKHNKMGLSQVNPITIIITQLLLPNVINVKTILLLHLLEEKEAILCLIPRVFNFLNETLKISWPVMNLLSQKK